MENQDTARIIRNFLNSKYWGSSPLPPDLYWFAGQACIAQYYLDRAWCRGRVVDTVEKGMLYNVEFVDFGSVDECTAAEMRKTIFMQEIPVQCFKLKL